MTSRLDLGVTCPFCGAEPGQECGRDRGPGDPSHRERLDYMREKAVAGSDLHAAKERLGAWLAEEDGRTHRFFFSAKDLLLDLIERAGVNEQEVAQAVAECPTAADIDRAKAAAILAALEKVNG